MRRGWGSGEDIDFEMRSRVAVRPAGQNLLLAKGRLRGEPQLEFNWSPKGFPEKCRRPQG
jgi:hypothetical protein